MQVLRPGVERSAPLPWRLWHDMAAPRIFNVASSGHFLLDNRYAVYLFARLRRLSSNTEQLLDNLLSFPRGSGTRSFRFSGTFSLSLTASFSTATNFSVVRSCTSISFATHSLRSAFGDHLPPRWRAQASRAGDTLHARPLEVSSSPRCALLRWAGT